MLTLDTNILIALQKWETAVDGFYRVAVAAGEVMTVLTVVIFEAHQSLLHPDHARRLSTLDRLLSFMGVLDFDTEAAARAAHIHHDLRSAGTLIDDADLLIAATALCHEATLVTRNTKHFKRISGLNLLDWQQEPQ